MEIRLNDNSRLIFTQVRPGLLNIELWKPGNRRDGHGRLLQGSTLLAGEDLQQFLSGLQPPEPELPLAA